MELLLHHEAFLRAIFDVPEDDTPRLVYADFLDENGEAERAELIRLQCELARIPDASDAMREAQLGRRIGELVATLPWLDAHHEKRNRSFARGFPLPDVIELDPSWLNDPLALRRQVVTQNPHWYGSDSLGLRPGRPLQSHEIEVLLELPFVQQVQNWNLAGHVEVLTPTATPGDDATFGLVDLRTQPAITTPAVEALARQRGIRRMITLDLRNNNLDNDAARALANSPYLISLQRLDLLDGNRLRGKVWQQLIQRYGEKTVG